MAEGEKAQVILSSEAAKQDSINRAEGAPYQNLNQTFGKPAWDVARIATRLRLCRSSGAECVAKPR